MSRTGRDRCKRARTLVKIANQGRVANARLSLERERSRCSLGGWLGAGQSAGCCEEFVQALAIADGKGHRPLTLKFTDGRGPLKSYMRAEVDSVPGATIAAAEVHQEDCTPDTLLRPANSFVAGDNHTIISFLSDISSACH